MTDPLHDAVVEVVQGDPQLRARVSRLIDSMLDHAEHLLDTAPANIRAGLIRGILPSVVKELRDKQDDAEIKKLRVEMTALMGEIRSQTAQRPAITVESLSMPVDGPPIDTK